MTTAIYVRVSDKSQDTKSQEVELKTWAAAQTDEIVWFKDKFSGTVMKRPGIDRMLADMRSGKVQRIVVWRIDRLGRTAKGLVELFEEFQTLNVGFVSLREGLDLGTPAGRLMACIMASVAAYETEVRRERQMAGIAKAKAEGKTWGGRKFGTRIKVTEEKEALIHKLHAEGAKIAAIARLAGISRKTVYTVIERHENKGEAA